MFITFEGGEGSGKTTQATRLASALIELGKSVVLTREPGGTLFGERIRRVILQGGGSPLFEVLALSAARANHIQTKIQPALDAGAIVVCDRFVDSNIVYQGKEFQDIHSATLQGLLPDITFLIDIPAEVAEERIRSRGEKGRFSPDQLDYASIRESFLSLAKTHERFSIINGLNSPDDVHDKIMKLTLTALDRRAK